MFSLALVIVILYGFQLAVLDCMMQGVMSCNDAVCPTTVRAVLILEHQRSGAYLHCVCPSKTSLQLPHAIDNCRHKQERWLNFIQSLFLKPDTAPIVFINEKWRRVFENKDHHRTSSTIGGAAGKLQTNSKSVTWKRNQNALYWSVLQ